ncbi:unnamed protein product [Urochloa humidicola]
MPGSTPPNRTAPPPSAGGDPSGQPRRACRSARPYTGEPRPCASRNAPGRTAPGAPFRPAMLRWWGTGDAPARPHRTERAAPLGRAWTSGAPALDGMRQPPARQLRHALRP